MSNISESFSISSLSPHEPRGGTGVKTRGINVNIMHPDDANNSYLLHGVHVEWTIMLLKCTHILGWGSYIFGIHQFHLKEDIVEAGIEPKTFRVRSRLLLHYFVLLYLK